MIIYLDDIVVHGTDPKAVWMETLLVMQRLIEAGFMLNIRKSALLTSELKLLGFMVGAGLRKPVFP